MSGRPQLQPIAAEYLYLFEGNHRDLVVSTSACRLRFAGMGANAQRDDGRWDRAPPIVIFYLTQPTSMKFSVPTAFCRSRPGAGHNCRPDTASKVAHLCRWIGGTMVSRGQSRYSIYRLGS